MKGVALEGVGRIDLDVTVLIGAVDMPISEVTALSRGAVIPLGRDAATPLAILANGVRVASARVKILGEKVGVCVDGGF